MLATSSVLGPPDFLGIPSSLRSAPAILYALPGQLVFTEEAVQPCATPVRCSMLMLSCLLFGVTLGAQCLSNGCLLKSQINGPVYSEEGRCLKDEHRATGQTPAVHSKLIAREPNQSFSFITSAEFFIIPIPRVQYMHLNLIEPQTYHVRYFIKLSSSCFAAYNIYRPEYNMKTP